MQIQATLDCRGWITWFVCGCGSFFPLTNCPGPAKNLRTFVNPAGCPYSMTAAC
jgi:hypothetical protein